MSEKLIEKVEKLRDRLNTQDNRITSDPLFCVQQKRRIYGLDPKYCDKSDNFEWMGDDDEYATTDYLIEILVDCYKLKKEDILKKIYPYSDVNNIGEHDESVDEFEMGGIVFEKLYYVDIWEFVSAHFTEAAAKLYIDQNRHNLFDPRVYVTSQYRCWEWNDVRRGLMSGEIEVKDVQHDTNEK